MFWRVKEEGPSNGFSFHGWNDIRLKEDWRMHLLGATMWAGQLLRYITTTKTAMHAITAVRVKRGQ